MKSILEFLINNSIDDRHLHEIKTLVCKYFGEATKKFARGKDTMIQYSGANNKRFKLTDDVTMEMVNTFGNDLQDICKVSPDVRKFPTGEVMANYRITAWPDDEGNPPFICVRLNSRDGNIIDIPAIFVPEKNMCK